MNGGYYIIAVKKQLHCLSWIQLRPHFFLCQYCNWENGEEKVIGDGNDDGDGNGKGDGNGNGNSNGNGDVNGDGNSSCDGDAYGDANHNCNLKDCTHPCFI